MGLNLEVTVEPKDLKLSDVLAKKRTDLATERTDMATGRTNLAVERTVMAAGRTMMAWIRTGLSLIGFGFTIYKFLDYLQELGKAITPNPEGPRRIGLFLIGLGTVSLLLGIIEYWTTMKKLNRDHKINPWKASVIAAFLIVLLGFMLFFTIIFHIEVL